ncbi:putative membrane protein [Virgibacillus halotolerans]|uniref:QueT transporter family protein n=1 Tax=Virgibacillus halotolerans TaxID=1071053 RepID=UPI0019601662|nr:QueT transporter family protein [Virgibacillus halotolerans]MBM7599609.1 putative membrane protein [Virgibacillus halotolerans]
MHIKTLVTNALIAALYITVSLIGEPLMFSNIQFRIPEMFNHLVVFNKKYFFGIILGVLITNLFSPLGMLDLIFGVAQSVISLLIIILLARYIKNTIALMTAGTLVFTFNMFIIAYELNLAFKLPFLFTWLTTAVGEFTIMAIGIPIMYALNKRLKFNKLV